MTRRRPNIGEAPGQDSFLDIVANLVGILIILVMVIGARAQDAMLEAAPLAKQNDAELETIDVESARARAKSVEQSFQELDAKIKQQDMEIDYRRRERDKMQFLLASVQESFSEEQAKLDDEQQQQFELQQQLIAAREELGGLQQSVDIAEGSIPKTAIIEHLPTPMAKTVFGKELHFRLLGGRITHVPWDELGNEFRDEAQQKIWRLKDADHVTDTVGPIGGFMMKYTLIKTQTHVVTRVGPAVRQAVELDRCVLIPVEESLGEPIADAFAEGSRFQSLLAANAPDSTTITIWTYPDSFNDFRDLKQQLFKRGYLTASRPLADGQPMSASPSGTRSAAQ